LACLKGHLEVVQFLHENRTEGCIEDALILASVKGHLEVVKYVIENTFVRNIYSAMEEAGRNCQFEVLKLLKRSETQTNLCEGRQRALLTYFQKHRDK